VFYSGLQTAIVVNSVVYCTTVCYSRLHYATVGYIVLQWVVVGYSGIK
jgi:hypothetical protein